MNDKRHELIDDIINKSLIYDVTKIIINKAIDENNNEILHDIIYELLYNIDDDIVDNYIFENYIDELNNDELKKVIENNDEFLKRRFYE